MTRPLLLVLLAGPALADRSLPVERGNHGNWKARCAVRMERARDEAARRDPAFAEAVVEAISREVAAPGDPTARGTVDVVEMTLYLRDGQFYDARVDPDDASLAATPRWTSATDEELAGRAFDLMRYRKQHGLAGVLAARQAAPDRVKTFREIFQRAVDDCLAMGKGK